MKYSDFADYPRPWNRQRYPVVAHVFIATSQFRDFERLIEDQAQTTMLGHDVTDEDQVLVYVACSSDDVKLGMSKTEQQELYDLIIGDRSFRLRGLSSECSFEILADDDAGDIHLICAASARAYALTVNEAESLAHDLLGTVAQMRITRPAL